MDVIFHNLTAGYERCVFIDRILFASRTRVTRNCPSRRLPEARNSAL